MPWQISKELAILLNYKGVAVIEAETFIEAARNFGFQRYTGVPCSFLTPLINYVINDTSLNYLAAANEGDAVAAAAGAAIGGEPAIAMMQNSGLGNAVNPLTSLNYIFRIPIIMIITHRGAPKLNDEPQHELMGRITTKLLDDMHIPWAAFPDEEKAIIPALQKALQRIEKERRPYGFIMQKGAVAPHDLRLSDLRKTGKTQRRQFKSRSARSSRSEALANIIAHTPETNTVVIASTGFTGRELFALADRPNQLYLVGSMGCAASLGLGLALARPDLQITVIEGDGATLMRMGNLATIGSYGSNNLFHIVLDNEAHDSTGAQATVTRNVRFADIAAACGYAIAYEGDDIQLIPELLTSAGGNGARFGHLKIRTGTRPGLPRPTVTPPEVCRRLMRHIGTRF